MIKEAKCKNKPHTHYKEPTHIEWTKIKNENNNKFGNKATNS